MKAWGRICFLLVITLSFVFAVSELKTLAQDSSPKMPARKTKTRFSDVGSKTQKAKSSSSNTDRVQYPLTACGPGNVSYGVHLNETPPPDIPPAPGKAMVYFIHDSGGWQAFYPTTLMALDGNWVGANRGDSYFSVAVDTGEHHVCAALQTTLFGASVELTHFTAEAGRTYYFRTRLMSSSSGELLELEPVDSDQGKYLAATFPLSESKPKK